jgi:hypothetical protein
VNDNAIFRKQYNVFFDKICDFEENLTFFLKKNMMPSEREFS